MDSCLRRPQCSCQCAADMKLGQVSEAASLSYGVHVIGGQSMGMKALLNGHLGGGVVIRETR